MTGYETFELYQSLKLHFSQKSYNFFKYNGKTNVSVNSFENRKDKYYFYKLSRKYTNREDMIDFLVANFLESETVWAGDLLTDESDMVYKKRQKVIQSLSYQFNEDCLKVFDGIDNPNDVIKVKDGDYPKLLTMTLQRTIQFETLCILNMILNFLPVWDKNITDTIRYPNISKKVTKYTAFLPSDVVKYKLILKKILNLKD